MAPDQPSNDPAFLAAYGAAVRDVREERGLDRKELAASAGISYSYLSAIESGQKLPSATVQTVLATALETPASDLLARANGELHTDPSEEVASNSMAAPMPVADMDSTSFTAARLAPRARRIESDPGLYSEPGVSASGALAELQALIPSLSPEDAAMVVSMARRLAAGGEGRGRSSSQRSYRGSSGRRLRTEAYLQFWTQYVDTLTLRQLDWAHGRRPEPRSYFTTPSPIRGASLSASFARNRLLRHEMYINRGSRSANLELLHALEANRALIEKTYGGPLEFEDPGRERRAVRIAEYREGHISRTDEWSDYIEWFIDRGTAARRAIDAYLAAQ
jgi:transcriptional regulator with XRE-family HTH domain